MAKIMMFGPAAILALGVADLVALYWRVARGLATYEYSPLGSCLAAGEIVSNEVGRSWVFWLLG